MLSATTQHQGKCFRRKKEHDHREAHPQRVFAADRHRSHLGLDLRGGQGRARRCLAAALQLDAHDHRHRRCLAVIYHRDLRRLKRGVLRRRAIVGLSSQRATASRRPGSPAPRPPSRPSSPASSSSSCRCLRHSRAASRDHAKTVAAAYGGRSHGLRRHPAAHHAFPHAMDGDARSASTPATC